MIHKILIFLLLVVIYIITSISKSIKEAKLKRINDEFIKERNSLIDTFINFNSLKNVVGNEKARESLILCKTINALEIRFEELKKIDNIVTDIINFKISPGLNLTFEGLNDLFVYDLDIANNHYIKVSNIVNRYNRLYDKYDLDKAVSLYEGKVELGYSVEELVDALGEPTKIEVEKLKTKTKVIYIYGNKSSGDVFVFVNDKLVKITDR